VKDKGYYEPGNAGVTLEKAEGFVSKGDVNSCSHEGACIKWKRETHLSIIQ
jgi:hypothetical protein